MVFLQPWKVSLFATGSGIAPMRWRQPFFLGGVGWGGGIGEVFRWCVVSLDIIFILQSSSS